MATRVRGHQLDEFTWGKFWASAWGGAVLGFLAIPDLVWVLLLMMLFDLVMGSVAALTKHAFSLRRLGEGIMRKAMAFFMLGAIKLMGDWVLKLNWDAMQYFAKAMISYEFLSLCALYIAIGGPGAPALDRFRNQVQGFVAGAFGKQMPPVDPDDDSAELLSAESKHL